MAVGRSTCCRCTTGPRWNPTDGTKAAKGMAAVFGGYTAQTGLETQLLLKQKPYRHSRQLKIKTSKKMNWLNLISNNWTGKHLKGGEPVSGEGGGKECTCSISQEEMEI